MPLGKKIEIKNVKPVDYPAVAEFLQQQKASDFTIDQWREKFLVFWDHNPFFREDKHERGWLLRDETCTVCGFLGNIPIQYARCGQEETGFALTTWYVRDDARKHSLELYGCFMDQTGVLINTTPTFEVEELLKGVLKFLPLTADWLKRDYFFPVRSGAFSRYLQERFKLHPLFKSINFAAAFIAMIISNVVARTRSKGPSLVDVKEVIEPPADTQQWWDAFKAEHPFTIARHSMGLRYFFFSGEYLKTRRVLELRSHGELLGFLGVRLVSRPEYSYVEVIDIALFRDDASMYLTLVDKLRELVLRWKPDIAFIKTNAFSEPMRNALNRSGFWSVAGRARFYYFDPQGQIGANEFYGTPLDGDRVCF